MTTTQGLHRAARVRGWLESPSGFVKMRGWNGNSRMVASMVIVAVLSVKHMHRWKKMDILQHQTLRHTCSENYQTQSSKGPYEKPAGVQQTYPLLFKGAGHTEDILLLSRDVWVLHCNVSSAEGTWLHTGRCSLCWLDFPVWKGTPQAREVQALLVKQAQYCEFPAFSAWELRFSLWCNILRSPGSATFFILKERLLFLPPNIKEAGRLTWDGYVIFV